MNKVVCVYNDEKIFEKVVKDNKFLSGCELVAFDNRFENISITKRYNCFIEDTLKQSSDDDFWYVFIHQDFGVLEDINSVLNKLNPDFIYGAVGVKVFKGLFWGKSGFDRRLGFKIELKLTFGQILQGDDDYGLKKHGRKAYWPIEVDAIDCCCIIIHSSLVNRYNLRFDENLSFHMYAEELCYRAKKDYKIKTKIAQMNCFHIGVGCLNEEYYNSAKYLKEKFKVKTIPSTCPN